MSCDDDTASMLNRIMGSGERRNSNDRDKTETVDPLPTISLVLDELEKNRRPIEAFFDHEHYLGSAEGDGVFYIISHFKMSDEADAPSVVTTAAIRCHDNLRDTIFMPTNAGASVKYLTEYLELMRQKVGTNFRPTTYYVCKKLITECLVRMKKSNKVLIGKEQRTISRLYGLKTINPEQRKMPTLPEPAPFPSVEDVWITLNRPEYFHWGVHQDMYDFFGKRPGTDTITLEKLKSGARYVCKDKYRRERMYALLQHHALWHMLDGEEDVASWLLWELKAMKNFKKDDEKGAMKAMQNNIILQLLMNKHFVSGEESIFDLSALQFLSQGGEYGRGMATYINCQNNLRSRGGLPPNIVYTASISGRSTPAAENDVDGLADDVTGINITEMTKTLRISKNGCAICGARKFKGGGKLRECTRCNSVVYCCREHQALHWKHGGHKQECHVSVNNTLQYKKDTS